MLVGMNSPSMTSANCSTIIANGKTKMATVLDYCVANGFKYIRTSLGENSTGSFFADPDAPVWTWIDYTLDYALDRGIMLEMIASFNPPINQAAWINKYNGSATYNERNRPPATFTDPMGSLYAQLCDRVANKLIQKGLPLSSAWLVTGNERAKGGVGGPYMGSSLSTATYEDLAAADSKFLSQGDNTWDDNDNTRLSRIARLLRKSPITIYGPNHALEYPGLVELGSIVRATAIWARHTRGTGINRYPATSASVPASVDAFTQGWYTRLMTVLANIDTNEVLRDREIFVGEFGFNLTHIGGSGGGASRSTYAQPLLDKAKLLPSRVKRICWYQSFDASSGTASDQQYGVINDDGTTRLTLTA